MPFVMRPTADGGFQLIGEFYIHGLMYGEGMTSNAPQKVDHYPLIPFVCLAYLVYEYGHEATSIILLRHGASGLF